MMKLLFITLGTAHALIHLIGFLKGARLKEFPNIKTPISGIASLGWMLSLLLLIGSTYLLLSDKTWWWKPGFAGLICSQIMIITAWKDAKKGTTMNLVFLLACMTGRGQSQYQDQRNQNQKNLIQTIRIPGAQRPSPDVLDSLPAPVADWLRGTGIFTKEKPVHCRILEAGQFHLLSEKGTIRPGTTGTYYRLDSLLICGEVNLTQFKLVPHSATYFSSKDSTQYAYHLGHLISVETANMIQDRKSALEKFLMDLPFMPSMALHKSIQWHVKDANHAEARIQEGANQVSALFTFTRQGDWKLSLIHI